MPNLSPVAVRKKYMLYDDKICTGDEAAECRACLEKRVNGVGLDVVVSRGDCAGFTYASPASDPAPALDPIPASDAFPAAKLTEVPRVQSQIHAGRGLHLP
jgi:hypothetical protein